MNNTTVPGSSEVTAFFQAAITSAFTAWLDAHASEVLIALRSNSGNTGPAAEMPGPENRGPAALTHTFSVDKIVAVESGLLDAFYGVLSAYRINDNNTVDTYLDTANAALQKLAEVLGMDLSREPFRAPLSALQGDA